MEQSPHIPNELEQKILSTKELLTFEEFCGNRSADLTVVSGFYGLFIKESMMSDIIRGQDFFVRFQNENKELEASLTKRISEWSENENKSTNAIPEDMLEDLYKAYTIMLAYDEVTTNSDLLK